MAFVMPRYLTCRDGSVTSYYLFQTAAMYPRWILPVLCACRSTESRQLRGGRPIEIRSTVIYHYFFKTNSLLTVIYLLYILKF